LNWGGITALFGGTFDPPHRGHREAVAGLFQVPGVKAVRVLPVGVPHKTAGAVAEHRLALAKLCFSGHPGLPYPAEVTVDSRELTRAGRPSYTFDTLSELGREIPRERLAFVIGTDQLEALPHWHRFPEVLNLAHWIVLERRPAHPAKLRQTLEPLQAMGLLKPIDSQGWSIRGGPTELWTFPTDAPEVSSTGIREQIGRNGQVPENSVIPPVAAYLKAHRIYGTEGK
jgi:nicotinate-nucleotide adenylyltransferase